MAVQSSGTAIKLLGRIDDIIPSPCGLYLGAICKLATRLMGSSHDIGISVKPGIYY